MFLKLSCLLLKSKFITKNFTLFLIRLKMYNTRKKYQPGFYQQLINGNLYEEGDQTKSRKPNELKINGLIKSINFNILKNLKSTRKASPTCTLKFSIENKVFIYLKNMFKFGTKFMESNEFLSKYNLERERCENQRYYCTASNFEFKLIKGKKLKFNQREEGKVISRQIMSNPTFCVSFFVKKFP